MCTGRRGGWEARTWLLLQLLWWVEEVRYGSPSASRPCRCAGSDRRRRNTFRLSAQQAGWSASTASSAATRPAAPRTAVADYGRRKHTADDRDSGAWTTSRSSSPLRPCAQRNVLCRESGADQAQVQRRHGVGSVPIPRGCTSQSLQASTARHVMTAECGAQRSVTAGRSPRVVLHSAAATADHRREACGSSAASAPHPGHTGMAANVSNGRVGYLADLDGGRARQVAVRQC